MKQKILTILIAIFTISQANSKSIEINSPDGSIKVEVEVENSILYSMTVDGKQICVGNKAGMSLSNTSSTYHIKKVKQTLVDESIDAPFYRNPHFDVKYTDCSITMSNNQVLHFRIFNDGVAYRFETYGMKDSEYIVEKELAEFNFSENYKSYIPYSTNPKKPEAMAFQATYDTGVLSDQSHDNLGFLPLAIDCGTESSPELKVTLNESDLESYPGMFVKVDNKSISGYFSKYPKSFDYYPWRLQKYVTSTEEYISRCEGDRTFPWRILSVSRKDIEMPLNNHVYALASSNRIGDTSWIKPGKVSWDWWNDWSISGVDFEAGINMETYKYYIDFASEYGLEYIILDEGWYDPKSGDMLTTIDSIDLPALVSYGKDKGVKLILWTVFNVLDKDLESACKKYSDMGIAGFKVDFLDRDDQEGVEMVYRIAKECARYKLLLDYHGIYKPTGINRTYPNIINFESVFGMEEAKWTKHDEKDMPLYDVTFPFIRQQSGFVDFTPGGMRNATKKDFQPIYNNPLTMGTRCHQLAMYIIHDSPLTMLADNPTSYLREPEYTRFMSDIPTVFDETRILMGKLGEYIVTARRKGDVWYIGGQTNWKSRDLMIDLSSLGIGIIHATIYSDGLNAEKNASDYKLEEKDLSLSSPIKLHLASGGGFVIKFKI